MSTFPCARQVKVCLLSLAMMSFQSDRTIARAGEAAQIACCLPDASCVMVDKRLACWFTHQGIPRDEGVDCDSAMCEPLEACCYADSGCFTQSPCSCLAKGARPLGPGTDCASTTCPVQACCLPDGSCADFSSNSDCLRLEGSPQGPQNTCANTVCEPFEACCFRTSSCHEITPTGCVAFGGIPQGPGTTCEVEGCDPVQACCLPDGGCVNMDESACWWPAELGGPGGRPLGFGSNCASADCDAFEACCLPRGCSNTSPSLCPGVGGTSLGPGTVCADSTCPEITVQACCLPDDCCIDVTFVSCDRRGGQSAHAGMHCGGVVCPLTEGTDWQDFASLWACLAGPRVLHLPDGCSESDFQSADRHTDGDVDLQDAADLMAHFGG